MCSMRGMQCTGEPGLYQEQVLCVQCRLFLELTFSCMLQWLILIHEAAWQCPCVLHMMHSLTGASIILLLSKGLVAQFTSTDCIHACA